MKPSELMIGDWVSYNGQYLQVAEIYSAGIYVRGLMGDENKGYPFEHLEPIMLTAGTLEKNGFKRVPIEITPHSVYGNVMWKKCINHSEFRVRYSNYFKLYTFEATDDLVSGLLYVHEFQNSLRICGVEMDIDL